MEKHVMQYQTVHFNLNGKDVERTVDVRASLTDMLRNDFRMTSVKKGCEVGECGACNVLIDGEAYNSCIYLAVWAEGKHIRTLEGLLGPNGSYKLSILKAADGTGRRCLRQTFEYPGQPGTGHFLHTYAGDGDPLPSFAGEPEQVAVEGDIDSLVSAVWDALDEANRISLFVRFTDLETRNFQQRIVNKYSGKETQA